MNLQKRVKKVLGNERGVTLIELLAVIIILAIIAAVAIPTIMSQMDKAKENTDKQNEKLIEDAVSRLITNNPGTTISTAGVILHTAGTGQTAAVITLPDSSTKNLYDALTDSTLSGGPFLTSVPTAQQSGETFTISTTGHVALTP